MWHDRLQVYDIANTVRTQTHRLTVYLDQQSEELYVELFDYEKDPLEMFNFANDPDYQTRVSDMRKLLNAGWTSVGPAI